MSTQASGSESVPCHRNGSEPGTRDAAPCSTLDMLIALVVAVSLLVVVPWVGRHAANGASKWIHAGLQAQCPQTHPASADITWLMCSIMRR